MVADNDFSHGSNFGARIRGFGFVWSAVGENISPRRPGRDETPRSDRRECVIGARCGRRVIAQVPLGVERSLAA